MAAETTGAVFASTTASRLDRDVSASASFGARPGLASGPGPGPAPLSASLHDYSFGHSHSHSTSVSSDPSLEPTIRALLEQQADIEAKLAALLPRKYGPNVRVELDMLRHKLRVLRAFASDNREYLSFFPFSIPPMSASLWCSYGYVPAFICVVLVGEKGFCLMWCIPLFLTQLCDRLVRSNPYSVRD